MKLSFSKYQGTGNDFVIIDNRNFKIEFTQEQVETICNRRFGIGSDGLILIQEREGFDFEMIYYNADGIIGSMCGNGGRCAASFAYNTNIADEKMCFYAYDGPHAAVIIDEETVSLQMSDVDSIEKIKDAYYLNTGSPHFVKIVDDVEKVDVYSAGRKIRFNEMFRGKGTNVDFIEIQPGLVKVRTYERGVENETLSCGTGVCAAAIAADQITNGNFGNECFIQTKGGNLKVRFNKNKQNKVTDIWLEGQTKCVFKGNIKIDL